MAVERAIAALGVLLALALGAGAAAALTYDDVTTASGLLFVHAGDQEGSGTSFLEVIGSGVCWGDVDGDGLSDAYLVDMQYHDPNLTAERDPRSRLFLNDGDGTFTDVSAQTRRAAFRGWGTGCSLADFDADLDLDLLVTAYDDYALYRNDGTGRFDLLPPTSGITAQDKCGARRCWAAGSAWGDYDLDGDLDVYVTNYVDWDIDEGGPISPEEYNGQPNVMFRNDGPDLAGGWRFTDTTAETNTSDDPGPEHSKAFQPVWFDHDLDGDLDIYIASDGTPNSLLLNEGGVFRDVARAAGVDDTLSSMGLDIADEGGDGLPDLFFTHFEGQHNGFYTSRGDGTYRDRSGEGELADDWRFVSWGTGFHDLDHDRRIDLYTVNGHAFPVDAIYKQHHLLWLQNADGTYRNATDEVGTALLVPGIARGSAVADYDQDGDLDIIMNQADGMAARLLRASGVQGNWLQVELRGAGNNTLGVGAWLTVSMADGSRLHRLAKAGNSFMSQDWGVQHFGLGAADAVEDLEVRWPDGTVQHFGRVFANQRIRVAQGAAGWQDDTLAPRTTIAAEGPQGSEGWFRGAVDVSLATQDLGVTRRSGVAVFEARLDGAAWSAQDAMRLTEDGVHLVEGRARDHAGNQEPPRGLEVRIDATPPRTTLIVEGTPGSLGWYTSELHMSFRAEDATSGIHVTAMRLDGGPWRSAEPFNLTAPGEYLLEYLSRDRAGNMEPSRWAWLRIDLAEPQTRLVAAASAEAAPLSAVAVANDTTSGIARVEFYLDAETRPRHVVLGPHLLYQWDLAAARLPPGLHVVRARAVDVAGLAAEDERAIVVAPGLPLTLASDDERRAVDARRTFRCAARSRC